MASTLAFRVLAAGLFVLSVLIFLSILPALDTVDWHLLVAAVALAVVLERTPVGVTRDITATISSAVVFVAIAAGGLLPALAAAAALGLMSFVVIERDRFFKTAYNVGMDVVDATLAAVTFSLVVGTSLVSPDRGDALANSGRLTVGLLAAGVVYLVSNAVLVALPGRLLSGAPIGSTILVVVRQAGLTTFLTVGLSAIGYTVFVEAGAVSLTLLIVPLLVARQALLTVQSRQQAFDRMVRAFVAAIQAKDGYTRGHAERVSDLSVMVAERMGLSYDERELIRYGAILHDVGKIGVSIGVLCKAGPLTDDEFGEMKQHPEIGAEMLSDIDFLKPALAIVEHHHERLDGRGYPTGLEGDDIPLLTRIVTAVDAFDAMTSTRPYRRALPVSVAIEELQANAGTQFCPRAVEHLVAVIAEHGWELTDVPVHAIHGGETS